MKPKLKPPGTKRLKLKCDIMLSTSALKFKLRRYIVGVWLGMSLWVTVIFETYKQQHRAKIAKVRVIENKHSTDVESRSRVHASV